MTLRRSVLATAQRLHLEPPLRRVQLAFSSYERRRDWKDNRAIERLLAATLTVDANCIDVGACDGDVLRHVTRLAPRGRHVAFEPLPEQAAALRSAFPDVDVRQCALHDEPGTQPFHRVRDSHWHSSLRTMGFGAQELDTFPVAVERLDDVLPEDYVPALIKIDVEGAEGGVLVGAERTLRCHRPVVVLEHGAHAEHFARGSADVFRVLTDAGLRVFDIDGGGPYDAAGFAQEARAGRLWTFVARPC
jgi:FkbM family methyltransferase